MYVPTAHPPGQQPIANSEPTTAKNAYELVNEYAGKPVPEGADYNPFRVESSSKAVTQKYIFYDVGVNNDRECFFVLKAKKYNRANRYNTSFSPLNHDKLESYNNDFDDIFDYMEITKGLILLREVEITFGYDNTVSETIKLEFVRDRIRESITLNTSDLRSDPFCLYEIAMEKRVFILSKKYAPILTDYILMQVERVKHYDPTGFNMPWVQRNIIYHGFYCRPNQTTLQYGAVNDSEKTANKDEMQDFMGIKNNEIRENIPTYKFAALCLRILSEMRKVYDFGKMPVLVIETRHLRKNIPDICELFEEDMSYVVDKNLKDIKDRRLLILDLDSSTKYNLDKYLSDVMHDTAIHPSILVTSDASYIRDNCPEYMYTIIYYQPNTSTAANLNKICNYVRYTIINIGNKSSLFVNTNGEIDVSTFPKHLQKPVFYVLWILRQTLISMELNTQQIGNYLIKFKDDLLKIVSDPYKDLAESIIDLLHSGVSGIKLNRNGNVFVMADVMKKFAADNRLPTHYAGKLADEGLIRCENGNHTVTATMYGRSQKVYEFQQGKLFGFGELRAVTDDSLKIRNLITVPIGKSSNVQINVVLADTENESANNILMLGPDNRIKRNAEKKLISTVAGKGLSVVVAETFPSDDHVEGSMNCFCEKGKLSIHEELRAISFDEILSPGKITYVSFPDKGLTEERDSFLMALYDFKKKEKDTHILLIIRDGNSWSTEDKSPLVNYILDKGRRFGIITCFLADMLASRTFERKDDLQRLFATYISFGNFTFRPWEKRFFGIPSGECPEKQAVEELAERECIANGALATENCYIRYPLIIDAI